MPVFLFACFIRYNAARFTVQQVKPINIRSATLVNGHIEKTTKMKQRITLVSLFILACLTACSEGLDSQVERLVISKNKWISATADQNYSYELTIQCFCTFNKKPIAVITKDGDIVKATYVNNDSSDQPIHIKSLPTVKSLFITVLDSMKNEDVSVTAKYDQEYGYPSFIKTKVETGASESAITYSIKNMNIY